MSEVTNGVWFTIDKADKSEFVGSRSAIILGCDSEGNIAKTFYTNGHPKGDCWLMRTGEGLYEWDPVLWTNLPEKFQDKNGMSFEVRLSLGLLDAEQ